MLDIERERGTRRDSEYLKWHSYMYSCVWCTRGLNYPDCDDRGQRQSPSDSDSRSSQLNPMSGLLEFSSKKWWLMEMNHMQVYYYEVIVNSFYQNLLVSAHLTTTSIILKILSNSVRGCLLSSHALLHALLQRGPIHRPLKGWRMVIVWRDQRSDTVQWRSTTLWNSVGWRTPAIDRTSLTSRKHSSR